MTFKFNYNPTNKFPSAALVRGDYSYKSIIIHVRRTQLRRVSDRSLFNRKSHEITRTHTLFACPVDHIVVVK